MESLSEMKSDGKIKKKYNVKAEICKHLDKVDLQELCDATEEAIIAGGGFGWLSGNFNKIKTVGLDYLGRKYKVPHMGWNNLHLEYINHPILKEINEKDQYYFVHSYYLEGSQVNQVIASTNYCHNIPAIVGKENYLGVQFHPEKSSLSGQKLISNWLKWSL